MGAAPHAIRCLLSVLPAFAVSAALLAQSTAPSLPTRDAANPLDRKPVAPGSIAGIVRRAEDGFTVAGAFIELKSSKGQIRPYGAMTDRDGRFRIADVPPGAWTVTVSKTGFLTQASGQRFPLQPSRPVEIASGMQSDVSFALIRGAVITGYLLDQSGDPVAGATVEALRAHIAKGRQRALTVMASDVTDDTGSFRLHSLPAGEFYLAARLRNGSPEEQGGPVDLLPTFHPGTSEAAKAIRVALRTGEERSGVGFAVTPVLSGSRLSGLLLDSTGAAVEEGRVELVDPNDGRVVGRPFGNFGFTGPDGLFTILNVPPGTYALSARVDEQERRPAETAYSTIEVSEGGSAVTLTTRPAVTISGAVVAAVSAGAPGGVPTGIWMQPARNGAAAITTEVSAGRTFSLSAPGGPASLGVNLPAGWALLSIVINGADVTDQIVDLAPGAQASAQITITNRVTGLAGTVADHDGSAAAAAVLVFPADRSRWHFPSRSIRLARADADGRFRIDGLPATSYLAVALDVLADDEFIEPDLLERLHRHAVPVTCLDGQITTVTLTVTAR